MQDKLRPNPNRSLNAASMLTKVQTLLGSVLPASASLATRQRNLAAEDALQRLQCNVRGSLLTLMRKEQEGNLLSRTEWEFLAEMSYQTYDTAYHQLEVIDRDLVSANMLAFAAVLKLRDEQYPGLVGQAADRYYWGNMGFSWADRTSTGDDLQAHVQDCIKGLPQFPSAGCGNFSTRNFDVSLRNEPELDQERLNHALRPFLRSILLVCLYGYWRDNQVAILTDNDKLDGRKKTEEERSMRNFVAIEPASNAHFHLSAHATDTTISVAIEPRNHPYVFALNNYVELTSFASMLLRISPNNRHASMPEFELAVVPPYSETNTLRYMLGSGRWRHFFNAEEFEALKKLFQNFFEAPSTSVHLKKLEQIYGRI